MNIIQVLNSWDIEVPGEDWFFEYLCDNRKENIFYIDRFPMTVGVNNAYKYDQMDIFYQEVFLGEASKNDFTSIETKYVNAIDKLWVYNKTFVEFSIPTRLCYGKPIEVIDEIYRKYLPSIENVERKDKLLEIKQKSELEFWTQLGTRDIADVIFYLEDYKAIIYPSWSCFIVYLHDMKNREIIKDIVASEGLFLRK